MANEKILLVEDDFALAMGTEYTLKTENYEVVKASNLAEAKALLHPDIDLVLLDVMLPDGNGYDFCRYIREHDNYVPVIFLTAVSDEVNLVQGLELGADDYIAKPYRVKELLTRIAVILRRQKYNSDTKEKKEETEADMHGQRSEVLHMILCSLKQKVTVLIMVCLMAYTSFHRFFI